MPEPVEVAINAALIARAQAFATANSVAISHQKIAFTPPVATPTAKWLRATFLPVPTATLPVGSGADRYSGVLQIDVFWGATAGEYLINAERLASSIINYFGRGTVLTKDGFTVRINKRPSPGPMIVADGWAQIPITINFECFATA